MEDDVPDDGSSLPWLIVAAVVTVVVPLLHLVYHFLSRPVSARLVPGSTDPHQPASGSKQTQQPATEEEANFAALDPISAAIASVRLSYHNLADLPPELAANREVLLEAVKIDWGALQYIPDREAGCSDREVVFAAVSSNALAIQFASQELRADRELLATVVAANGLLLEEAASVLRDDPVIVARALCQNGLALEYASDACRRNAELVKQAVTQNALAFQHADPSLHTNRECAVAAVQQDWRVLESLGEELLSDRELMLIAARQNGQAFGLMSSGMCADRELLLECLQSAKNGVSALDHAADSLLCDGSFVLEFVNVDGTKLAFASEELRGDPTLALAAVAQTRRAQRYVSESLLADVEFQQQLSMVVQDRLKRRRDRLTSRSAPS